MYQLIHPVIFYINYYIECHVQILKFDFYHDILIKKEYIYYTSDQQGKNGRV